MTSSLEGMIRDDFGWFLGKFADIRPELRAAEATRAMIVRRTRRRHVDAGGAPFAPYAPSTLKRKARKGQSMRVTMTDTGQMLDGMKVVQPRGHMRFTVRGGSTVQQADVRFGSRRDERIANYHISDAQRAKIPKRDFFGLTEREERVIYSQMRADVQSVKQRDRRRRHTIRVFQ